MTTASTGAAGGGRVPASLESWTQKTFISIHVLQQAFCPERRSSNLNMVINRQREASKETNYPFSSSC